MYIHETDTWPNFTRDRNRIDPKLAAVNKATGYLEGILSSIGFDIKERAAVEAYTHDIVASSEIEALLFHHAGDTVFHGGLDEDADLVGMVLQDMESETAGDHA